LHPAANDRDKATPILVVFRARLLQYRAFEDMRRARNLDADIRDFHSTTECSSGEKDVGGLQAAECKCKVCLYGTKIGAIVCTDTARQIDRDDESGRLGKMIESVTHGWLQWPRLPCSEQGIDKHWRRRGVVQLLNRPVPTLSGRNRRVSCRFRTHRNPHIQTAFCQFPGRDIAIAAIVARAAKDQRRPSPTEAPNRFRHSFPCPLHQRFNRNPISYDRIFSSARFRRSQDGADGSHHCDCPEGLTIAGSR
jgi:hypothetical protein